MSYPPKAGNGAQGPLAVNRWRPDGGCAVTRSRKPCPPCTVFLTDHHSLKLVTFVGSTEASDGRDESVTRGAPVLSWLPGGARPGNGFKLIGPCRGCELP